MTVDAATDFGFRRARSASLCTGMRNLDVHAPSITIASITLTSITVSSITDSATTGGATA